MSRRVVHDRRFTDAMVALGLDETSPELRWLETYVGHEIYVRDGVRRPGSRHAAADGGDLFIHPVQCPGGGRLLVAYRDDGSIITLLDLMRQSDG